MTGRHGRKSAARTAGRTRARRRGARAKAASARERVDLALRENEPLFRDLLEAAPDAMVIVDETGGIVLANAQTEQLFGYPRTELVGQAIEMLIPERFRGRHAGHRAAFAAHPLARAMGARLDLYARHKDGSEFPVEISLGPLRVAYSMLVTVAVRDVSERRRIEQELRASEARLNAIIQSEPECVKVVSPQGVLLEMNRAGLAMLEAETIEQVRGSGLLQFIVPEHREAFGELHARVIRGGAGELEFDVIGLKGGRRRLETHAVPLRGKAGEVIALLGITRDITERKRAEEALREHRYFLQKAQAVAHIGYWISGPSQSGAPLVWSPEAHCIFGIGEGEFDGRVETFFSLVHPEDLERLKAESLAALAGQRPYRVEHRIVRPDGAVRWVYQEADIAFDAGGRPLQMFGVTQDITERKEAELLMRESGERYRYLFDANPVPMWVRDAHDGAFLAVNDAAVELYGYTREEFSRLGGGDLRPEEELPAWREFMARRDPTERTVRRWRHRRKNGEVIDVEVTSRGFSYGTRPARLALIKDITEQLRAERSLRESEERFRAAFEQAAVGMALRDLDPVNPRWLRVNQKLCDILGYEREELLRLSSVDLTPPEERQLAVDYNERMQQGDISSYAREKRYVRKDGRIIWTNISLTVVRDEDGKPLHVLSVIEDISERKRAEEALRQGEERSRSLIEMSPSPIVLRQGDLVAFANPAALQFFGAGRPQDIVGRPYLDLIHPDEHERVRRRMSLVDLDGQRTPVEVQRFRRVDGETAIGEASGVGFSFQGQVLGIVAIYDLTERLQAELAAQELNAELERRVAERTRQLEQANQELESFAYSVSHDLRAPLRSIDGFSKALLEDYEGRLDDEGRDYLRRVRRATLRMGALIDDLLGLSRVGRVEMHREAVNLAALAQEIVDDLRRQEPDRDVEVAIATPLAARGDPSLLRIALQNLLQNAWKFTSRIAAARIEVGRIARNGRDTFYVRDNGVGFDMAYAGKLFNAFQRLHADAEFAGTGVGLATVQRIIRRHEGEVNAEAAVGRGATIFFTLGTGAPAQERAGRD